MPSPHTLPVPAGLLNRACDELERRFGRLPFVRSGIELGRDLIAATLEELNAEATRTLALSSGKSADGWVQVDGLDLHLAQRGFAEKGTAGTIAEVLVQAGVAQRSSVTDRRSRRIIRGVRLLPAWTWTIATTGRDHSVRTVPPGKGDSAALSWTDLCPVCRAGRLEPVSGQRLFGIPETDFYACTSCGARFVPDSGRFRLAAIAKKQDPLHADLMSRSFTHEEWQAIAQGDGWQGRSRQKAGSDRDIQQKNRLPAGRETGGRITVELEGRTLYFTALPLVYAKGRIPDLYALRREPVSAIIRLPAFQHLAGIAGTHYRNYLDLPVGLFLHELKNRRDPFCHRFLNSYGELPFCSFRAGVTELTDRRGVYVVAGSGILLSAGAATIPFRQVVDDVLGLIPPQACYLDGDPGRCRVNSLLCSRKGRAGLFVHPLDDGNEIARMAAGIATLLPVEGSQSAHDPAGCS